MTAKERLALFSSLLFVLGGGVGSVYLLASVVGRYNPALGTRPVGALESIVGIPLLLGWILVGLVAGSVLWLLVMTPFFTRDELRSYFTRPEVPAISRIFAWLFERFYPR